VQAPSNFDVRIIGKTVVNKTAGTKYASEDLKGRVFKVSLADLSNTEELNYKVIHLIVEDVQGDRCLTNYHGLSFTTDKVKSLVRKWQTLIEARVDVKTTDGYTVRLFCIGFTKRRPNQVRKTSYAQSSQIRKIRKKMVEIMNRESQNCDLRQLFDKM
jgi:small subunit ribosomal protein S3Ae